MGDELAAALCRFVNIFVLGLSTEEVHFTGLSNDCQSHSEIIFPFSSRYYILYLELQVQDLVTRAFILVQSFSRVPLRPQTMTLAPAKPIGFFLRKQRDE